VHLRAGREVSYTDRMYRSSLFCQAARPAASLRFFACFSHRQAYDPDKPVPVPVIEKLDSWSRAIRFASLPG
jgi:hypothetical protein